MSWLPKKNVVVPIDFSDESLAAVDTALEMVDSPTQLHVIHVLADIIVTEPGVIWEAVDDESRREHALSEMKKRLTDFDTDVLNLEVGLGDPGHVIVELAEKAKAGLIVIPSHGRTGLSRAIMGSVAERIVRYAHCPVLVLKST